MSNYPAGVTGGEPAIAGYPEGTYHASEPCEHEMRVAAQPVGLWQTVQSIFDLMLDGKAVDAEKKLNALGRDLDVAPEYYVECGYEGDVDAAYDGDRKGNGTFFWICPRCNQRNEEHREAGDDHPDL